MKKYFLYSVLIMVSLFGTTLTDFALGVWVLEQPESSISDYSLIWFFEGAPEVFLAPFIGSFVDRWDKKKMIIYGQLAAGIGSLILMALHYYGSLLPWHIMAVAAIGSVANTFVFTAFYVTVTALVSKDKLIKAKGITAGMYAVISILVPMAAPVLYEWIGMGNIFLLDISTFTFAIGAFLFIKFVTVEKTEEEFSIKNDWNLVKGYLLERKGMVNLLIFFFAVNFLISQAEMLFTPMVLDFASGYTLGIILSVIGFGTIVGGIITGVAKRFKKPIKSMMYINVIVGVVLGCFWINVDTYALAGLGMIVIICFTISDVIKDAFFQTVIPVKMLGRLTGFFAMVVGASGPLAHLLSGVFVDGIKAFVTNYSPTILDHFPGTGVTASIIILFAICGLGMIVISIVCLRNKPIMLLNGMYTRELEKEKEKEQKEEEKKKEELKNKEKQETEQKETEEVLAEL